MNLKLRIGEMLQGRSLGNGGDAGESVAMVVQQRLQEDAQRTHMRRLFQARVQELDELRGIMRRQRRRRGEADAPRHSNVGMPLPLTMTRPPGGVDGSQLISLINELEVKILSEPMGLTGRMSAKPDLPIGLSEAASPVSTHLNATSVHPLDDPALMVAARRWNSAADLLLKTVRSGELPRGVDWATRSAIDLLERGGRFDRARALRLLYQKQRGRDPVRLLPSPLPAPTTGRLQISRSMPWTCPTRLDFQAASSLTVMLSSIKAGTPLLLDWTAVDTVDVNAFDELQHGIAAATRSRHVFAHRGLSTLIRTVRLALKAQHFSRPAWDLWLAVLNWTGFRTAHRTAASAYAKRFNCESPVYLNPLCICHALNSRPTDKADELVCGALLLGDLMQEHAAELDRLPWQAASPGKLVVLDLRQLTSMDFFFAADLLNWIIRRHTQGESVALAYAHPLLSHFLQMLGFQNYAKVHGLPSTGLTG